MLKPAVASHDPRALINELAGHHDDADDLNEEELRDLNDAIDESAAQLARGEGIPAEVALAEMRQILYGR